MPTIIYLKKFIFYASDRLIKHSFNTSGNSSVFLQLAFEVCTRSSKLKLISLIDSIRLLLPGLYLLQFTHYSAANANYTKQLDDFSPL